MLATMVGWADPAYAAGDEPKLKYRIAVDQFKWTEIRDEWSDVPRDLREGLQAQLVDKLHKSGLFTVMEREAPAKLAADAEREINEAKRQSRQERGQAAGQAREVYTPADYVITPTVAGYQKTSRKRGGFEWGPFSNRSEEQTVTITLNIRIFDAMTSETIETSSVEGQQTTKKRGIRVNLPGPKGEQETESDSPVSKAVDEALGKAVALITERISKQPWYALVATQDVTTGRVIIAAGNTAGVKVGQEFVVNHAGEPVIDPGTGDVISRGDETKVGRIRIVRVERSASFADVLDGTGFKAGDVVRLPK